MKKTIVQDLLLVAGSVTLTLTAVIAGLKLYAHWLDIHDASFHYENQLHMWRPDTTVGFVNKQNFTSHAWGNVLVHTNERGFRDVQRPEAMRKAGVRRIIGVGDSVMWGTGVNQEDSFLGILERKLKENSMHEVINGGVVGYSTYQEMLFLEKYVLPLEPDIVLVNYCENDLLPTEDPFGNVREIYLRYLTDLLQSSDRRLTPENREKLGDLIRIFTSPAPVWSAIDAWKAKAPDRSAFIRKAVIETPMVRMDQLSRTAGVRLIYVLVPPESAFPSYLRDVDQLKNFLVQKGIEFVDVQAELTSDNRQAADRRRQRELRFDWAWRGELRQILLLWRIEAIHQMQFFIDGVHPTRRGNEIIAEHIYQYLQNPLPRSDGTEVWSGRQNVRRSAS